jgi:hypothetical protein
MQKMMSTPELLIASVFSILTLVNCGGILENKAWLKTAEILRIAIFFIGVLGFYKQPSFVIILTSSLSIGFISLLLFYRLNNANSFKNS